MNSPAPMMKQETRKPGKGTRTLRAFLPGFLASCFLLLAVFPVRPAQKTINIGAAANDATGDSLRSGGAKINDNFTELYGRMTTVEAAAAFTEIFVSKSGSDSTTTGGPLAPFLTVGAAYTFAETQSPSATTPIVVKIARGTYAIDALPIDTAHIHLRGEGAGQTVLTLASGAVSLRAANTSISDLSIVASGSNTGPLLQTDTVLATATYLANVVLRNVTITNDVASGVAVGRWAGDAYNCRVSGATAMSLLFGGRLYGCYLTGTSKVIEKSVSNSIGGEDTARRVAEIHGGTLEAISSTAQVFGGLVEGNTDFVRDGVCWFPTQLIGVAVWGPMSSGGLVGASAYTMRGTFIANGCTIYGANTLYQVHDGYINGCYLVNTTAGTNAFFMQGGRSFSITGCNLITGSSHNAAQFSDNIYCHLSGCVIENDGLDTLKGDSNYFHNLRWLNYPGGPRTLDYRSRGVAARFTSTASTYFYLPSTSAFALTTMTVEFWFKSEGTSGVAIGGIGGGTDTGWFVGFADGAPTGDGGTDVINTKHGAQTLVSSDQVLFDGNPHHVAFVVTGGTTTIYLDGTSVGTGSSGTPSGATQVAIGAREDGASQFTSYFSGDLWEIRISNSARYSGSFTPAKRMIPDSNTLALFPAYTEEPYVWSDAMGRYDATMPGQLLMSQNPYWVPTDRALP